MLLIKIYHCVFQRMLFWNYYEAHFSESATICNHKHFSYSGLSNRCMFKISINVYILYIIQADPSDFCKLVEKVPCSIEAREALRNLRAIVHPRNRYSFPLKCEMMERVCMQTISLPQIKMPFHSKITMLSILDKIILMPDAGVSHMHILSEAENMIPQITFLRRWIKNMVDNVGSAPLHNCAKWLYTGLLCNSTWRAFEMQQSLIRHVETMRNQDRPYYRKPKFLKDRESLNKCPSLKDNLSSSTKYLTEQTSPNRCSVCLERDISIKENFAILDKCVHLFCRICINRWFNMT